MNLCAVERNKEVSEGRFVVVVVVGEKSSFFLSPVVVAKSDLAKPAAKRKEKQRSRHFASFYSPPINSPLLECVHRVEACVYRGRLARLGEVPDVDARHLLGVRKKKEEADDRMMMCRKKKN